MPIPQVRRPTDCPYLPRVLISQLKVLVAGSGSFAEAFQEWAGRPEGFTQITSNAARVVGCAVTTNDCNVRAIPPTPICGSDLRMSYREIH